MLMRMQVRLLLGPAAVDSPVAPEGSAGMLFSVCSVCVYVCVCCSRLRTPRFLACMNLIHAYIYDWEVWGPEQATAARQRRYSNWIKRSLMSPCCF